jgi:hypothetical protein
MRTRMRRKRRGEERRERDKGGKRVAAGNFFELDAFLL